MFDGPLSASAYELLGVAPSATDDDLRRAYRLRLRQTHPDTGGDATMFVRVQRAWEMVGTPQARSAYDRGRTGHSWAASSATPGATGTRPRGRSFGQAGAWRRSRYRELLAAELGHPVTDAAAYDPLVVRAASWEARRMLADALAEEATAAAVDELGIGFTAWHDVALGDDEADKLDHVVLAPSGLYGLLSEDFGAPVRFRQGEVIGVGDAAPIAALLSRMRRVARSARVRFGGGILILPDDALDDAVTPLGGIRGVPVVVVRRSALRLVLRTGVPGARVLGGNEAFDVRSRLIHSVRVLVP
ncbi:J domain-containing protein [Microbacterium sp. USHLN186]|uniref:J domain-containing protein n=1 Tax=Microbacterium sp. USHLN186 TaxID=3081286 RepID=UPI003016A458